jgi:predicted nicotinamide N-methyase
LNDQEEAPFKLLPTQPALPLTQTTESFTTDNPRKEDLILISQFFMDRVCANTLVATSRQITSKVVEDFIFRV